MAWRRVVTLLFLTNGITASPCPNISSFRSSNVIGGKFDAAKLGGLWYEVAFIDPAQIGAACQTLNSSIDNSTGVLTMPFKVDYFSGSKHPLPFTIVEEYFPTGDVGVYDKIALPPFTTRANALATARGGEAPLSGTQTLTLPTVFVDVTAASTEASYDTMTLYSCLEVAGIAVAEELIFASRDPNASDDVLAAMEEVARSQGVEWEEDKLKRADYSGC